MRSLYLLAVLLVTGCASVEETTPGGATSERTVPDTPAAARAPLPSASRPEDRTIPPAVEDGNVSSGTASDERSGLYDYRLRDSLRLDTSRALLPDSSLRIDSLLRDPVQLAIAARLAKVSGLERVTVVMQPGGVALLGGWVRGASQRSQAQVIALRVPGVEVVENRIEVVP